MRSASTMTAPRAASSSATVDFPAPIPPVNPITTTPADPTEGGRGQEWAPDADGGSRTPTSGARRARSTISLRTPSSSHPRPEADRTPGRAAAAPATRGPEPRRQDPNPASAAPLPPGIERPKSPARPGPARRLADDSRAPAASAVRLPAPDPPDRLRPYRPLVTVVRWGTVLVGVVLTASDPRRTAVEVVIASLLVGH